jgi:hypothetical protein
MLVRTAGIEGLYCALKEEYKYCVLSVHGSMKVDFYTAAQC